MNFVSIRVITEDVARLAGFYERVTGLPIVWATEDFAQLQTENATLAIGSTRTVGPFAQPGQNRSVLIEFLVDDVDAVFGKLNNDDEEVVQEPTTMPWGNRSLLLRDPDGNVVNLFSRPQS